MKYDVRRRVVCVRMCVGEKNRKTSIRGRIKYIYMCLCVSACVCVCSLVGEESSARGGWRGSPLEWIDSGWTTILKRQGRGDSTPRVTFNFFFFLIKYYRNPSDRLLVFISREKIVKFHCSVPYTYV